MKPHPRSLAQARAIAAALNLWADAGHGEDTRRLDADETNMLALALEQMRSRVYEQPYPELKARRFLPVASDVDPGADSFSYEVTDEVGIAKVITNYADDPPSVETKSSKHTHAVKTLGDSFFYSIQDLRRAAFSGRPLQTRKAMAARRAYERGLDQIAAFGAPSDGIADGIANRATGTGDTQIRNTTMTAAAWDSTPVAADMVADLNKGIAEMVSDSRETHVPNLLILPTLQYLRLAHTYTTDGSPESALQRFLKSNGFVSRVEMWDAFKSVDGSGGNFSRALLANMSPEVVELVNPEEFSLLPPQQENFGFKVLGHGRTAGACIYQPLGLRYLTGLPDT